MYADTIQCTCQSASPSDCLQRPVNMCVMSETCLVLLLQSLVGYTESQLEDLLAVRSLFVAQVGRLLAERNSLLDRMSKHSHNLTNVQAWAERLQQNIAEEHEMYIQAVTAQYLGVSPAYMQSLCAQCFC